MILSAGLQGSGSTLISWCFLQHANISGELDMPTDTIRLEFDSFNTPWIWNKMTISSFRWLDLAKLYEDLGWRVYPLLIARDVRTTFASLTGKKHYGINSNTSEDPPLRIRFRRFLQDWKLFQAQNWPVMKYEEFINEPVESLKRVCFELGIEWDDGMVYWTKDEEDIFNRDNYNQTFMKSVKGKKSLFDSVKSNKVDDCNGLALEDLRWLDHEFTEYNRTHGYQPEVSLEEDKSHGEGSLLINPNAARRVLILSRIEELEKRNRELKAEYGQLKSEYGQLKSEYDRLRRTRAVRLAEWFSKHPKLVAGCGLIYDKAAVLLMKK